MLVKLSNATLPALPESILKPGYDRAALSAGIVHIGVGNFHRAHQAWYLHRLMQVGQAYDWAILGAGVRSYDAGMREKLIAQDCLTTLLELSPDEATAEVVGSMIDYLPVEAGNGALIAALAEPAIRIVSMTVTEGGYYQDPATGAFDPTGEMIVHDAAHPSTPQTAFGAIVAALRVRREQGIGPFTVLSCDNLKGNGDIARQTVVGLAGLSDPELATWIDNRVAFPNSMVDTIVPATGPGELALARSFGIDDAAPVTHENFRQWVIEDSFCAGRPNWDEVGATFTKNVHAYEAMKLRILNAGHQMLANAGELLNLSTIDMCMSHPLVGGLVERVQAEEVFQHVQGVPEMTPADYLQLVTRRFANPAIKDTTRRVAFDGSSRHPGFILPIVHDALASDAPVEGLALTQALWARMCAGVREDGSTIEPNDPNWDALKAVALQARDQPDRWVGQSHIYGEILANERFAHAFSRWLSELWSNGTEATLGRYLAAS
ncbi:MAG: mannitol dehydrogenase family protein [Devosiaceae bacterium]|nr:mannitol dehydrogenase family protein [Devosiaceae bacterium MH13]